MCLYDLSSKYQRGLQGNNLLLLSVAALCAASIFFLREESRNYFKELEVETSALADTRVCLTDAGDGAYYLMLPEADSSKAHFVLDGEYSASIDGAALTQKIAAIPGVSAVSLVDHDGETSL